MLTSINYSRRLQKGSLSENICHYLKFCQGDSDPLTQPPLPRQKVLLKLADAYKSSGKLVKTDCYGTSKNSDSF